MDHRTNELNRAATEAADAKELNESEADQVTGGTENPGKYGPTGPTGRDMAENPYGPRVVVGPKYHHHEGSLWLNGENNPDSREKRS